MISSGIGIDAAIAGETGLSIEVASSAADAALRPGQRLPARVIEILSTGDVLLALGLGKLEPRAGNAESDPGKLESAAGKLDPGRGSLESSAGKVDPGVGWAIVRPDGPLQLFERVVVEVVATGPTPAFRIVGQAAMTAQTVGAQPTILAAQSSAIPLIPQLAPASTLATPSSAPSLTPRDLPVILQALADVVATGVPMADAREELLRNAVASTEPRPVLVAQLQHLLAPLDAGQPTERLATTIRTFLAQSGLFTESHLLAAVKNGAEVPGAAGQKPPTMDLRLLLGQLTTAGQAGPDAVRTFGAALLQQQLDVAGQLAAGGTPHTTIPFMFGETRVDVGFEWHREARRGKKGNDRDWDEAAVSLGVFVDLKALGRIEARLELRPQSLGVTFFVEREATRALVEAGLEQLSNDLSLSGFPAVTSQVWLNPGRVLNAMPSGKAPVSGGTILDVMV